MRRLALLLLVVPIAAWAGKAEKADKELAAALAGDRDAITKALSFAESATKGDPDDPAGWAIRGRIWLELSTNPDLPRPGGDPVGIAVESYERAVAAGADGAVHAAISLQVPRLESAVVAALVNDVEGKQWADAESRLGLALRVRALADQLGVRDAAREAEVRRLAVRVTARSDLTAAKAHYEAFVAAAGRHDSGLAGLVAKELAESGDVDGALAFLAPLDEQMPDDERLLRTETELLKAAGRPDDATARIGRAESKLQGSVSGAFLAADLYSSVGAGDRARAMWERVLALDPRHLDSRVLLGRSLVDLGVERRAALAAREDTEVRPTPPEVQTLRTEMEDAFRRAEEHLRAARELDRSSGPAREAMIALLEAKLAGVVPAELPRRADREAAEALSRELEALRAEGG